MPSSILREVLPYVGVVLCTFLIFGLIPFMFARICRHTGRGRRCASLSSLVAVAVGLPVAASIAQRVAPLQEFLGSAGWLGVLALPLALIVAAGLFLVWRGPDREWRGIEIRRAVFGAVLCGFVGLFLVWRSNDRVWGWSIAMSGCGIGRGTVEFAVHRDDYRRLWWGESQGWRTLSCAAALDSRLAGGDRSESVVAP